MIRRFKARALTFAVGFALSLTIVPHALATEKPGYGGILRVAIAGDPPSLDMHQEQTFLMVIPLSTVYNTLVMFDPHAYPKVIGDLATSWQVSDDGLSWTFQLHQGVKFHDDHELTSAVQTMRQTSGKPNAYWPRQGIRRASKPC